MSEERVERNKLKANSYSISQKLAVWSSGCYQIICMTLVDHQFLIGSLFLVQTVSDIVNVLE